MGGITRRGFIGCSLLAAMPAAIGLDLRVVEPTWLRLTRLNLSDNPSCHFVHFTDLHYKGDVSYAREVVRRINELQPDFACFTGDLVEDRAFALEALSFIRQIRCPVYGVAGNHDYWSRSPFAEYERAFAATGGAWLIDRSLILPNGSFELIGMAKEGIAALPAPKAERRILLMHYPAQADQMMERRFSLMLAGHSHGGQVRIPFYGALYLPWGVGPYDQGFFQTEGGPLYVNAGIGTYQLPIRFNCRPELTYITI